MPDDTFDNRRLPGARGDDVGGEANNRFERRILFAFMAGILFMSAWVFLASPEYTAVMSEYLFKFLPAFTDGGPKSIFDGYLLGDPRARILSNFLAYMDVCLRRFVLLHATMPPTLGVSWCLYPAVVLLFGRAAALWSGSWRTGGMAAVLLASSPALLDLLANHYIPAKPLVLLCFAGGLWCATAALRAAVEHRRAWASGYFGFLLAGLMSDETAVFIGICVPILVVPLISWRDEAARRDVFRLVAAECLAVASFAVTAFLLLPAINRWLGQQPVSLSSVAGGGVYEAMFSAPHSSLASLMHRYAPLALLQTIFEAHFQPFRQAEYVWTAVVSPSLTLQQRIFAVSLAALWWRGVVKGRMPVRRLAVITALAFVVYVALEAAILVRLAPYIVEVSYYANFSSFFVALLLAVPMAAWVAARPSRLRQISGWGLIAVVATIQFHNYIGTASLHPMFLGAPKEVTWSTLRQAYATARAGAFDAFMARHTPTDRLFPWALEAAIARGHADGRRMDLQPFQDNSALPLERIGLDRIADPAIPVFSTPPFKTEADVVAAGGKLQPLDRLKELLASERKIRGRIGDWSLLWQGMGNGRLRQIAWRNGIMRSWYAEGRFSVSARGLCLEIRDAPFSCAARVYAYGRDLIAVSENGRIGMFLLNAGTDT